MDVWSEKCLPPGTVHLRVPRVVPIAKKLEIDFAPAMVGFEFRNGRSIPVFDGIVVCAEFKDTILEVRFICNFASALLMPKLLNALGFLKILIFDFLIYIYIYILTCIYIF